MSLPHKVVRAAFGGFLAVACALGLGGLSTASAAPAHRVPTQHCPAGHRGHYPPGKCRIFFSRGIYHPGQKVTFESGEVFKAHEKVTELLTCHHAGYQKHVGVTKARGRGRAKDTFRLSSSLTAGGCTLTLKGKKSGVVLNGHLKVRT